MAQDDANIQFQFSTQQQIRPGSMIIVAARARPDGTNMTRLLQYKPVESRTDPLVFEFCFRGVFQPFEVRFE